MQALLTFAIIVLALFLRGSSLPTRGELVEKRLPAVPRPERFLRPSVLFTALAVLLLIVLPFDYRQALMLSLIGTVDVSVARRDHGIRGPGIAAQVALAGVSGFVVSHLIVKAGVGFPWSRLAGSVAAAVLGLIIGASALRVRGVSLAVVTLAGAVAIEQFGFANTTWGAGSYGSPVEQPTLAGLKLGSDAGFRGLDGNLPSPVLGFVFVVVVVALCLFVANLRRSNLGQRMLAVRSNERAAAAAGISVRNVKFVAFALSSFIAGTAGWMYAYNFGSVNAARFGILIALAFVAFAYIGGITMVSGAVIGGLVVTEAGPACPRRQARDLGQLDPALRRLGVDRHPDPESRGRRRLDPQEEAAEEEGGDPDSRGAIDCAPPAQAARGNDDAGRAMTCSTPRGLSVRFGGVHALVDVDLQVEEGSWSGPIGPNGAGKTTFIDAITGFVSCRGRVELDGRDLSRLPGHARARLGLARTWQSIELFDDLAIRENLMVVSPLPIPVGDRRGGGVLPGRSCTCRLSTTPLACSASSTVAKADTGGAHPGPAQACRGPRAPWSPSPAADLHGRARRRPGRQRVRPSSGRACAKGPLDAGTPILLVDHDMGLVLGICDEVAVFVFGRVISRGKPDEVRRHAPRRRRLPRVGRRRARTRGSRSTSFRPRTGRERSAVLSLEGLSAGYEGSGRAARARPCTSQPARWSRCSVPTAPARRPRCGRSRASSARAGRKDHLRGRGAGAKLPERPGSPRHCPRARRPRAPLRPPPSRSTSASATGARGSTPRSPTGISRLSSVAPAPPCRPPLGGEQQMLAIGRALARRPKLLLLDELSLGLAPVVVERRLPAGRVPPTRRNWLRRVARRAARPSRAGGRGAGLRSLARPARAAPASRGAAR